MTTRTTRTSSKFTPAVRAKILEALQCGMPIRHACGVARIDHTTLYRWLERGKDAREDSTWHQFYLDFEDAQAKTVEQSLGVITQAAVDGDWKAAAWKLERRFPGEFGKSDRPHEPTGPITVRLELPGAAPRESVSEVAVVGQLGEGA